MRLPKVSVIMPVYNAGIYLKDAVQDLLRQSFEDFELICVDDGSSDQSLEVLSFFSSVDERVLILQQERKGAGAARNRGMEIAKGKYLLFLDADDRFSVDLLRDAYDRAERFRTDILVYDAGCFDSASDVIIDSDWFTQRECIPDSEVFSYSDISDNIFLFTSACVWNKLYLTEFIRKNIIRFQEIEYRNDVYFAQISLALANRISFLDRKLVYYRRGRSASVSSRVSRGKKPELVFHVVDEVRKKLAELDLLDRGRKGFVDHSVGLISDHLNSINEDNYAQYMELLEGDWYDNLRVPEMKRDDYRNPELYDDMKCLKDKGSVAFISKRLSKLVAENAWLRTQMNAEKGEETEEEKLLFDLGHIPETSRIVLYGAGVRGRKIYERVLETGKYEVVLWADRRFRDIKNPLCEIRNPEEIQHTEYDYIVIGIDDILVAEQIYAYLTGFAEKKKVIF